MTARPRTSPGTTITKTSNVSGISGSPESMLGEILLPLSLSGGTAGTFLGGEGSWCPALLSNSALHCNTPPSSRTTSTTATELAILKEQDHQPEHHNCHSHASSLLPALCLLLTDSERCLPPADLTARLVRPDNTEDVNRPFFVMSDIASYRKVRAPGVSGTTASTTTRSRKQAQVLSSSLPLRRKKQFQIMRPN